VKIGQKLILGFLAIAAIVGVVGYIGFHSSQDITGIYDEIVDETAPALLALGEIKANVNRIHQETVSLALLQLELGQTAEAENEFKELQETEETLEEWEAEYSKVVENEKEKEFAEQINEHKKAIYSVAMSLVNAAKEGKSKQNILALKEEFEEEEESFNSLMATVIEHEISDLHQGDEAADKLASRATSLIIVASLVAIIFAIAGGYFISRTISNPIGKLKDAAIEIGKGDLNKRAQVESKDEVGVLATSFNHMTDEIQKRNEELQTMNEELQSTNEELESSNEELRSTTEELETSNEELQSTTEELEASNEELKTANEELETAQEKLIQQEKLAAIGQLASGVGHELRNPLGVIKNAAYYIKTKVGSDDPKLAKHLTIMEREINNSNRIISDLLGFSRTRLPSIAPSDVNEMANNAMEAVEMPENVLLVKEFNPDLPKTMVDADQMYQVFVNLGLNAIQAMTEGGQLKIRTRLADDYVEVEFSDTGCGIPSENLKKLFDPFFSTKARGVGLGLAVTHGIVERNKCKIEVESKVSEGTTFVVKLPVEKQTSEKETTDRQKVTVS
jgi:signal transduction histidine kinase/HAMP domain-containing protein